VCVCFIGTRRSKRDVQNRCTIVGGGRDVGRLRRRPDDGRGEQAQRGRDDGQCGWFVRRDRQRCRRKRAGGTRQDGQTATVRQTAQRETVEPVGHEEGADQRRSEPSPETTGQSVEEQVRGGRRRQGLADVHRQAAAARALLRRRFRGRTPEATAPAPRAAVIPPPLSPAAAAAAAVQEPEHRARGFRIQRQTGQGVPLEPAGRQAGGPVQAGRLRRRRQRPAVRGVRGVRGRRFRGARAASHVLLQAEGGRQTDEEIVCQQRQTQRVLRGQQQERGRRRRRAAVSQDRQGVLRRRLTVSIFNRTVFLVCG